MFVEVPTTNGPVLVNLDRVTTVTFDKLTDRQCVLYFGEYDKVSVRCCKEYLIKLFASKGRML